MLEKALPSVFIGLFIANLLATGKYAAKANALLPYIERLTGLPRIAALVVIVSIADRIAGMAALAAACKQYGLSDRQVITVNLTAKAPAVVQFFVFSFVPLLAALFPADSAIRFLYSYFMAFVIVSLIGWLLLKIGPVWRPVVIQDTPVKSESWLKGFRYALAKTVGPFARIAAWMFSMSAAVMLFIKSEAFVKVGAKISLWGGVVDVNAIPIVAAGLISMIGGVAAVGAAWQEGVIAEARIVPLLFLTSIIHNVYDLFASSLPRAIAIYGRDLGIKVSIVGFVVTEAVMLFFFFLALYGIV